MIYINEEKIILTILRTFFVIDWQIVNVHCSSFFDFTLAIPLHNSFI